MVCCEVESSIRSLEVPDELKAVYSEKSLFYTSLHKGNLYGGKYG
jgi:hypothetical protein